ncbi:hypothetical protein [Enterococcus sp.]|uniref:hypothetical protein n=1 Tax=Enterococcus sp. TaxID=35783 RepID=UPI002FCB4042
MERKIEGLNGIYKQIAQLTSVDDCLVIYKNFKGLTINFPIKLIDSEYVKKYLERELQKGKHFSKEEIQQLAIAFDYSERQLRRFLREAKEAKDANQKIKTEEINENWLPYTASWLEANENGGINDGRSK